MLHCRTLWGYYYSQNNSPRNLTCHCDYRADQSTAAMGHSQCSCDRPIGPYGHNGPDGFLSK